MVNNKKRLFKLLFFPISLLLCLSIFIISSFASVGYSIDSNGNIESLNLWNEKWRNGYYDTSNGNYVYNSDYVCTDGSISLTPNTTYTISVVHNMDFQFYDYDGDFLFNITKYIADTSFYTFTTDYRTYYMTFYITDLYGNYYHNDIMLNKGSTLLDYFPYGSYVNNDTLNKMSLYNLFNGSIVQLNGYYDNLNNSYTMAIDTLNLSIEQKFITLDDLPNIKRVINNGRGGSDWIVNADTYYISFYLNKQQANFSVLFADFVSSRQYIRLSGSTSGLYDKFIYNTNENSQSFIFSTNGVEYLHLGLFNELGYNQNFKIGLSFSSSAYNDGYNDGYTSAINSGDSYNSGFNSGYQDGYNDGINTDLQTNGLRTLFNSILSFPVDMIKSVFNFEFMGVNIASVIMFIVSIGIVAFVLKKFL